MKKIIISFLLCLVGYPIFAQVPFVSFQPVEPTYTRPHTPPRDPMDPLGLGRSSSSSVRTSVNPPSTSLAKEHFGMFLGSRYDVNDIARQFRAKFGYDADCGGNGNFYQIRVYSNGTKEGATFGGFTIDFYKGKFWKIRYSYIQNDPYEFADKLERKYGLYSISDTRYEYIYDNIYIDFDGERLLYSSESVSREIADY